VARRSGLGRGLGALIPQVPSPEALRAATAAGGVGGAEGDEGERDAVLVEIPVTRIEPNPHQPRQHFDEEALASLVASVSELGVLQPVLVRPAGDHFQLIAGERRWRAAARAGLTTIPAIVREVADLDSVEQALIENLHREDLNPLEEAAAYHQLVEDFGLTHEEVARRVGRSRAAVSNTMRLLQLPASIQRLVAERRLSAGHARALLGTTDRAFQEGLARRAVEEEWSVRAVEDAVRARAGGLPGRGGAGVEAEPGFDQDVAGAASEHAAEPARRLRPPGLLELEELLSAYLDTRVSVRMGAKKGQVVIEFATLEDLERIYRRVTDAP